MKRRNFIKKSGLVLGAGTLLNLSCISQTAGFATAHKSELLGQISPENDRVLILIQLIGGNDGLNTIIPLDHYDNLVNLRPNIILPQNKLLHATDTLGFHPVLEGFQSLFADNKLSIIQNVGYPNQNRSHFRSSDIWNSGSPADEVWSSGWLGRYLERSHPSYPLGYPNTSYPDPLAINIGNAVSETCQGSHANFGYALEDAATLGNLTESELMNEIPVDYYTDLNFIHTSIQQANAYTKVITKAMEKGVNKASYPDDNMLAQQLKLVTKLISGGLKTKLFVLTLSGFDTHANQVTDGDTTRGDHANKLKILSDAIASFQKDLKLQDIENRITGMTTSEFGRQIRSNSSNGTDHGSAAPQFLFGSKIKKSVLGKNPEIPEKADVQAGLPMEFDFRDIYGSILIDWFGITKKEVIELLYPGFHYTALLNA